MAVIHMLAHGSLELSWKKHILYAQAFGPFNEEGILAAGEKYLSALKEKATLKESFSVIEIWDQHSITAPEAMEGVKQLWGALASLGCQSFALVVCNNLQKSVAQQYLPAAAQVFHDLESAENWVNH